MTKTLTAAIEIRSTLEEVWEKSQIPDQHVRWDIRFTDIEYLPKRDVNAPQQFLYATRIGFGLAIKGRGETIGQADRQGSALRFWSDDPKSLIREGSGGWMYRPSLTGAHFSTVYDYDVRYGAVGGCFDACLFRPLMVWATRWSFDRLRLWMERGIEPELSLRLWVAKVVTRVCLGGVWIYEGCVPKIWNVSPSEIALVYRSSLYWHTPELTLKLLGLAEIAFGLWLLTGIFERRMVVVSTFALISIASMVVFVEPSALANPFGGISKNLGLLACAVCVWILSPIVPQARRARPREVK